MQKTTRAPAPASAARVVFCTYHSAARVAEALDGAALDLLVCDEAHRCTGKPSKRDAQPLSDAFLRAKRRLFLTATPRLLSARRDADGPAHIVTRTSHITRHKTPDTRTNSSSSLPLPPLRLLAPPQPLEQCRMLPQAAAH